MKTIEKEQIRTKLAEFCEIKGGQNKAANSMRGAARRQFPKCSITTGI